MKNSIAGYIILCIAFWGISLSAQAQKKSARLESKKEKGAFYSIKQRQSFFPFQDAKTIQWVSFEPLVDSADRNNAQRFGLPLVNDTVAVEQLTKVFTLEPAEINNLTDILYNECLRQNPVERTDTMCYNPHDAILFYDRSGKQIGFIEICTICNRLRYSSEKIKKAGDCNLLFAQLELFYLGIQLRTTNDAIENELKRKQQEMN